MANFPSQRSDQLEWIQARIDTWVAKATDLGTTTVATNALKVKVNAAAGKKTAADTARAASKAATVTWYDTCADMAADVRSLITTIKAYAVNNGGDAVLALAMIDPPAPPQPATAPGKPFNTSVVLLPSGAVQVFWEADNASASTGGFFNISRKLPGGAFTTLTGANGSTSQSRTMSFVDFTVPSSAASQGVQYIIEGRRGLLVGEPSDAITVQFGVDGTGAVVTGATLMKAAA